MVYVARKQISSDFQAPTASASSINWETLESAVHAEAARFCLAWVMLLQFLGRTGQI